MCKNKTVLTFSIILFFGTLQKIGGENGSPRDSYLDAYQESHGITPKSDREYTEPFPYPPSQPGYQYGPPSGPPKYMYGPPVAPVHNYGPPPLVPVYAPPAPVYGAPHGMLGLLDKLKLKLDLFTLGKILLKVVLFKKFVSFVAILCLLLFIPSLKHKMDDAMPENGGDGDGDDDAMRAFGPKKYRAGDEFLSNISSFVIGAIDDFSKNNTKGECDDVYCKTRNFAAKIDKKLRFKRLAEAYVKEVN